MDNDTVYRTGLYCSIERRTWRRQDAHCRGRYVADALKRVINACGFENLADSSQCQK